MNSTFSIFKAQADQLFVEYQVKYSDKDPQVAAWMLDTMDSTQNPHLRDLCAAGLMCRYWSIFTKAKVGFEEDYDTKISYGWEAIEYALKYKAWQNPNKKVNADQAVKQCIHTIFLQHNYNANLDKAKANYDHESLDREMSDIYGGDSKVTLGDTIIDEDDLEIRSQSAGTEAARSIVQLYIDNKKLVEAIIFDTIAFNETEKVKKETTYVLDDGGNKKKLIQTYKEFWPFKAVQILSKLPTSYADYFGNTYNVNPAELDKALESVRAATNQKLYKYLNAALQDARQVFSY
jgi:hypothetical protein